MAFQIKPGRAESDNKSIRFPKPLIDQIECAIRGKNQTFSGFVIQACKYALANLEETDETDES